ncbi:MAG: hypothetical protein JXR80_11515 [Deltaproteobacteria bacterium]|nr:hypothetical protein [Deltaproteobacteria bacterium]
MARETQLDTHEIDKLLADDDFIDDFDFSEDLSDQFVDAEGHRDGDVEEDSDDIFGSEVDESAADDFLFEGDVLAGGPGVVASEDIMASVALDFDSLDLSGHDDPGRYVARSLKAAIGLALVFWLAQVFGVVYLLRQPVVISAAMQPLAAETDLLHVSPNLPATPVVSKSEVVADPDQPEIFLFTIYLPLYSLEGLKVFSAEVEVVQFQETGRVLGDEQKKLQDGLRISLRDAIGQRLREEIVDVNAYLSALIIPYIEKFFSDREVDLSRVTIRINNPYVQ